jgi:hypothetical protein
LVNAKVRVLNDSPSRTLPKSNEADANTGFAARYTVPDTARLNGANATSANPVPALPTEVNPTPTVPDNAPAVAVDPPKPTESDPAAPASNTCTEPVTVNPSVAAPGAIFNRSENASTELAEFETDTSCAANTPPLRTAPKFTLAVAGVPAAKR